MKFGGLPALSEYGQNQARIIDILEGVYSTIVYFELIRKGFDVSIGKIGEKEIDFIAVNQDEKKYFQVTESLFGEPVRKRELDPLIQISDNYEKTFLSMDKSIITSEEGIKFRNIIDFLLE